jgi:hypothetical protein
MNVVLLSFILKFSVSKQKQNFNLNFFQKAREPESVVGNGTGDEGG